MSRDDDSMGWSGGDKSPLVVMQPRQDANAAVAVTRTAGSLILILFMLAAVVLAVLAITMQGIYKSDREDEVKINPEARTVVEYRIGLENARRATPIVPPPTLADNHAQAEFDRLRAHNATLRFDNQARIRAAATRNQPRPEPGSQRRTYGYSPPQD